MHWYNYVACFFSGAFLANTIPHFVHGISGDKFPTPFAKPHGKGLSSPILNVIWALFNMVIGSLLFWASKIAVGYFLSVFLFFAGIMVMSIRLSLVFAKRDRE